ncbi:MAG: imidazolonepropionase [Synergistaceae bacterium]
MNASDKLFYNLNIYTPIDTGKPSFGKDQNIIKEYRNSAIYVRNGIIIDIGTKDELIINNTNNNSVFELIDMCSATIIPGFVDPHTHMCFANRRESEFDMRLKGATYLEILENDGGILSSVNAVKNSTEEKLVSITRDLVLSAMSSGTTTIEIKSGYGLFKEEELKMLSAIKKVRDTTPLDIVATFMAAHAVPSEYKDNHEGFIDLIIKEMFPDVLKQNIAEFCDVFCEKGVFTIDESRKLLQAAEKAGLKTKIHADEVFDTGGASLAAELAVTSAEHLLAANIDNLKAMGQANTIAVLLPATAYSLKKEYANARLMIDQCNLPVALATDCNPGSCFCESMPFVFGLAVMNMNMTVNEALVASTLNAAYAINRNNIVGSLEIGKQADFIVLDGESPTILAYHAGSNSILNVYKKGEKVI